MTLLHTITEPADLASLKPAELADLAAEIRAFLIEAVCRTGGHLGPNLGVVELTIALHRVFDSPRDPIVWDTGHQSYVHKLLTGRQAGFTTLRQAGGLGAYPVRAESAHDFVENSHASTSLSYVDGLAKAFQLRGENERVPVAVVGDGALTGGMCWEALNNLSAANGRPSVIVVNDNTRSYAPTIGGLAWHLAELRGGQRGSLFEDLGLAYVGPVDGHDLAATEDALRRARELALVNRQPVAVHVVTVKGKGYPPAEADEADCLHAVGVVDPVTGKAPRPAGKPSWTSVFGNEMVALGRERADVVTLTAAMLRPVGLHGFETEFPERVFDVGMAEQHAVTSAAGLAMGGLHPVVCIYATFLNRAFDQTLMDVALHRQPVTFVLDRAGVTGEDGPSHHGMWDLSLLSLVPGLRIAAPRDAATLRAELREAVDDETGPTLVRFPKGTVGAEVPAVGHIEGVDVLSEGDRRDVLLVAVGAMAGTCVAAAEVLAAQGLGVTVVDPRWVLPVNPVLGALAARHHLVVTVEDNNRGGGVGSALAQLLHDHDVRTPVCALGLRPEFLVAGKRGDLLAAAGLDVRGVVESTLSALAGRLDAEIGQARQSEEETEVRVTA